MQAAPLTIHLYLYTSAISYSSMDHKQYYGLKYLVTVLVVVLSCAAASAQQELAAVAAAGHLKENLSLPKPALPKGRAEKQQLLDMLKGLNIPNVPDNESDNRQWTRLAQVFTHFRMYPLAMKCFLKTLPADSLVNDSIQVTAGDKHAFEDQLKKIGYTAKPVSCPIIKTDHIINTFRDGKRAMAYAMILHVKQPVRGTRKVHKLANTGHTFITLIKFNTDSSYAAFSFGFGPDKDNLFAATPLVPTSSSKFTNDGGHEWDEVVGKFISRHRFERILRLTKQYDGLAYNLSTNNCTDFGLEAARLAGVVIEDTKSKWLMGEGNSPATTGESILLGKFSNTDTMNQSQLFIDTVRDNSVTIKSQ